MLKILCILTIVFLSGCGLQNQINDLKNRSNATEDTLLGLETRLSALEQTASDLRSQMNALSLAVDGMVNDDTVEGQILLLQTQYNSTLVQLATLQNYQNIVAIKDPCGDKAGVFDEVFLKLSTGHYLASFSDSSSGKNTRFSVLVDGQYETTDGSNCEFTVSGSGTVISNEHY